MSKNLFRLLTIAIWIVPAFGVESQEQPPQNPPAETEQDRDARTPAGDEDDVFIPTEEIPADEEITFPVNI